MAWDIRCEPMSKRHVEELSRVYAAILRDAAYAYPTLEKEFERDLERLHRSVVQRGIHVYVVDLPALGKHLDRCLSEGEYMLSGLPLSKRMARSVPIPKFLGGLYLLVFNATGSLKEDYDVRAVFFLRQILYAAKKAALPCSEENTTTEVREFFSIDASLPTPERFWESEDPAAEGLMDVYAGFASSDLYQSRLSGIEPVLKAQLSNFLVNLDHVSRLITTTLGPYRYGEWRFKHGPGAISQVTGPTNKYRWFSWSQRLENSFPMAEVGYHSYNAWAADAVAREISSEEPYSRLIAVLKTYTKPRLIAAEPVEHQWCQQNVWHYFRSQTAASWIGNFVRFTDQKLNQELCLRASSDGTLATVDLKSASDRVTCHAVGQMFRRNPTLLLALQASRTRRLRQTLVPDLPEFVELKKFSTMGSACTFPVETLIFLAVVLAAALTVRRERPTAKGIEGLIGDVAVFGDDLICPVDSRELLFAGLELLDFRINLTKSFWTGRFRESCGVDAYAGVTVTPAYWHNVNNGKPEAVSSTIAVANNFYTRFMLHTVAHLESTIPEWCKPPLVPYTSGFLGLKSFVTPRAPSAHKARWNAELQRMEYLLPVFSTKQERTPIRDDTAVLQYFTEDPSPFQPWKGGVPQCPSTKLRRRWVALQDLSAQQVL